MSLSTEQRDEWALEAYARTADEALCALDSSETGLSAGEARQRMGVFGRNALPETPLRPWWRRLASQFHNVLIYLLLVAGAVMLLQGHGLDAVVIAGVVIINVLVGFIQEGRAEAVLRGILGMVTQRCMVLRDGLLHAIDSSELVPGDVVQLSAGDRVPADVRLLSARQLRVDEAGLTGESSPVSKRPDAVERHVPLAERHSMAWMGTLVTAGQARGVVIATGTQTRLGEIGTLVQQVHSPETPLTQQLARFGRGLAVAILLLAGFGMAWGVWVMQLPVDDMFRAAVGISVAAIPEGLPAIVTIALAIGVRRMASVHAVIRKLPAVEVLGSVSVICSDKTGTLTRNEMAVRAVALPGLVSPISGEGYAPEGSIGDAEHHAAMPVLARVAALCNDARVEAKGGEWVLHGDPTEGALAVLAAKAGFASGHWQRVDVIPFDAERRYMATLHHLDEESFLLLKGAPERVVGFCASQMAADGNHEEVDKAYWEKALQQLAGEGMRVMALACKPMPAVNAISESDATEGLVLLGFVGMADPPRAEAREAIAQCHQAGIRVCMITGDNPVTANAIAKQLGIESTRAVTGDEIDELSEPALRQLLRDASVFARTSPAHKLRIVEALQADGRVVAMTGDGVNDAPALHRADIGVAMGKKGTDAARDAAHMVLLDDNFASIAKAVREGRNVYDNIVKSIVYILPTSLAEAAVIMVAILFGWTLPITPVQILWVNMVTTVTLSLALAFESAEEDVMQRPPRRPTQGLISRLLLWRLLLVGGLATAVVVVQFFSQTGNDALARTLAVNTLVMTEIFYLFSVRRLHQPLWQAGSWQGSWPAWVAVGLVLLMQLAFTYMPVFQLLFETAAMSWRDWLSCCIWASVILLVVEIEKAVMQKWHGHAKGIPA